MVQSSERVANYEKRDWYVEDLAVARFAKCSKGESLSASDGRFLGKKRSTIKPRLRNPCYAPLGQYFIPFLRRAMSSSLFNAPAQPIRSSCN